MRGDTFVRVGHLITFRCGTACVVLSQAMVGRVQLVFIELIRVQRIEGRGWVFDTVSVGFREGLLENVRRLGLGSSIRLLVFCTMERQACLRFVGLGAKFGASFCVSLGIVNGRDVARYVPWYFLVLPVVPGLQILKGEEGWHVASLCQPPVQLVILCEGFVRAFAMFHWVGWYTFQGVEYCRQGEDLPAVECDVSQRYFVSD